MLFRVMIGSAVGLLAGAGIGYFLKSRGGTCPLTCNPIGGAIFGALFGGMLASSLGPRRGVEVLAGIPSATTVEQFDRAVAGGKPLLVDFYTQSCGYCVALAPRIAELARQYEGKVDFLKVDLRQVPELGGRLGIQGVPTVVLFAAGAERQRWAGVQEEKAYRLALDAAAGAEPNQPEGTTK
ncbi:MAG TPA: DUF6132 family protein [Phycisphaerae bacterium]|nr:DUF6132 family protein [Phycisphaerae bacterium]